MGARTTDKKRFKRSLRIVQELLRDNLHGATVEGTATHAKLAELDATLRAIQVPGDEPDARPAEETDTP